MKLWESIQVFTSLPWYKYSATTHLPFSPNSFIQGQTQVPGKQMRILSLTSLGSKFSLQQGKEKQKKKKKKTRGSKSIWRVASCPPPQCPQSAQPEQRQARGEVQFGHTPLTPPWLPRLPKGCRASSSSLSAGRWFLFSQFKWTAGRGNPVRNATSSESSIKLCRIKAG